MHREPTIAVDLPAQREYRPALDGIRAVAVLAVVVYHLDYAWLPGGFLGVDVFFVLSGYLITGLLIEEWGKTGRIRLLGFWARRARRLLPALALLLVAVAVLIRLLESPGSWYERRIDGLASVLYVANWRFIISGQAYFQQYIGASPFRHLWSLAVEEQYYVVWPVAAVIGFRLAGRNLRRLTMVVAALALASVVWMAMLYDPANPTRAYEGTDARVHQLLIGALLALVMSWLGPSACPRLRRELTAVLGLAVIGLFFAIMVDDSSAYYRGGSATIAASVALLIWSVEVSPSSIAAKALSLRPIAYIGRISYGIYLWHWPVIVYLTLEGWSRTASSILKVVVSVAAAALSYHVVEQPVRRGRPAFVAATNLRMLVGGGTLLALAAGVIVLSTSSIGIGMTGDELQTADRYHCEDETKVCIRRRAAGNRPVMAVAGDSTALSLDPALMRLAEENDWTYVSVAANGCGIAELPAAGTDREACAKRHRDTYQDLIDTWHPALLFAFSRTELNGFYLGGQIVSPMSPEGLGALRTALAATARRFVETGSTVAFIEPLENSTTDARCLRGDDAPRCSSTVSDVIKQAADVYRVAARDVPNTFSVNLLSSAARRQISPIGMALVLVGGPQTLAEPRNV